jgi:phosphoenolpyruvate-protein kinase (PTS system EI component)
VLAALDDPTLAERAADVRSLGRRAAATAAGVELRPGGIVIADDLGPADVADLGLGASGAALAHGGVTAHAAIVARSLGIPMVVALGPEALDIGGGEEVVVDADHAIVVRNPDASRVLAAHAHGARRREAREAARRTREEPAQTTDGHRVTVLVNAATAAEAIEGFEQGAEGIGLLRTELPFLDAVDWPSTRRQVDFLEPIFARLAGRPATVRLFDFGADKTPPFLRGTTARGIDLLLESPDALRCQLSAILEAAHGADVRILVPMVTAAEQLRTIRQALPAPARLGAMIETPEAARSAVAIAAESDFFSIGTNDLTQLVLGLDRERSRTAPVLDGRVLRLIAATVRAAHDAGIVVDVCGEAASDPQAMPVLVGLGVDELSVAAARVGLVRASVRDMDYGECRHKAAALLDQA